MSQAKHKKRIAVICFLDGYANSSKPTIIKAVLSARGHDVTLVNTKFMSRLGETGTKRLVPSPRPAAFLIYILETLDFVTGRFPWLRSVRHRLLLGQMKLRAALLAPLVSKFDVVVCESPIDSLVFLRNLGDAMTIYDCATPLADEHYYGGELGERQYARFKQLETEVYRAVDHLSFHWACYADYVKKHYEDTGNIFIFDGSAAEKDTVAHYAAKPKIVYLGYLAGYWINLPLLSRLSKLYDIDVYGAPEPPSALGLHYKGYAKPSVLAEYQFGIITITDDQLRSEGFSAKHVEYLSYGLPVLVPTWRVSARGMKGTLFYDEDNFLDIIKQYSKRSAWQKMSDAALAQAGEYSTDKTMRTFIKLIER